MADHEKPDMRTLDPRSLRGLAHPLRIRLLAALRLDGPATASQLATRLGESSGATSYHLRQLAAHGFVEDDAERGKGRERWWKAAHAMTNLEPALVDAPDAETRGAADLFLHEVATIHTQELSTWLGARARNDWPKEWVGAATVSDYTLCLTPELALELKEKLLRLIDDYRRQAPEPGTPGLAQVRYHLHALPRTMDGEDAP
ncbi:winged helix-turn-helix domain-containing protein [Streptomyces sp. E11-3]|uniref:ArsR/SmtB family transcription factor n=1 Tax=Streptomyces sp. E11-3 TaxID=3110112 RepID=UPI00397F3181